ncbi:MAG: hypothetical protein CM1200mP26_17340 [Acidimicrobiales bacterium]|nr:MAG: hypothetical protein CM1200mP26_17340 [Acidimicrobiales bacterium]
MSWAPFPGLGIALDVVATTTRTVQANRDFLLVATVAFGFLSFGAFAQTFFDTRVRLSERRRCRWWQPSP